MPRPLITLTTDYGLGRFVAQMKGAILSICPEATIVDIAHDVPAGDQVFAAYLLHDVVGTFPEGTVHVVVADPGVGSRRRAVAMRAGPAAWGHYFVGPDAGAFGAYADGGLVYSLDNPAYRRRTFIQEFTARDVFAPAAAHLANGAALENFGASVVDPVRIDRVRPVRAGSTTIGEVLYADPFGNLVTNIEAADLPAGDRLVTEIAWARIPRVSKSYGDVGIGEMVSLIGATGRLEVAVREGSALQRLDLTHARGHRLRVVAAPKAFLDD